MLKNRAIRLSVRDRLTAMFEAPDAATGLAAFNVYTESNFRAVQTGTFTPTFPYIYLLDSFLAPMPIRVDLQQPQVIVEIDSYINNPFQLGDRLGRQVDVLIHIFGRNRGERDDLGGFIADYFGSSLEIKTYSASNPTGTKVEDALVDPLVKVKDIFTPRIEKIGPVEAATDIIGWTSVALTLRPKQ